MDPTYYYVHVVHERDAKSDIKARPPQPDNQIGPYGDDPVQYGELYVHVWSSNEACEGDEPALTREQLCAGGMPRFREDWVSALATGMPWDDDATNEDASFVFDKRYCIKWTDVSAHPWQGSVTQLDHSTDPWQAEWLLEGWLYVALMRGTAPEKRPGRTQPARQPSWGDPWWDAE